MLIATKLNALSAEALLKPSKRCLDCKINANRKFPCCCQSVLFQ